MRFDKVVSIMKKEIVEDGFGGKEEKLIEEKEIICNITRLRRVKQLEIFGEVSNDSFSMICLEEIDIDKKIKYNDKLYKIEDFLEGFRKFSYTLRVDNNGN